MRSELLYSPVRIKCSSIFRMPIVTLVVVRYDFSQYSFPASFVYQLFTNPFLFGGGGCCLDSCAQFSSVNIYIHCVIIISNVFIYVESHVLYSMYLFLYKMELNEGNWIESVTGIKTHCYCYLSEMVSPLKRIDMIVKNFKKTSRQFLYPIAQWITFK